MNLILKHTQPALRLSSAAACIALVSLLSACGPKDETKAAVSNEENESGSQEVKSNVPPFASLDTNGIGAMSTDWCSPPSFTPGSFVPLDQETLATTLATYTRGWMTPLHKAVLGFNEVDDFDSMFEVVMAASDTYCDWNSDDELRIDKAALLDIDNQQDAYDEVYQRIMDAEFVASSAGDVLRIKLTDCADCAAGLAQHPVYFNARMTSDGVIVLDVELGEGQRWLETLWITPSALVAQAPLDQLSVWWSDVAADTPDIEETMPEIGGTFTAMAIKQDDGAVFSSVGLQDLSFQSQPGGTDNVRGTAIGDCLGFYSELSGVTGEGMAAANVGHLSVSVPGSLNCQTSDCGTKETTQDWVYTVGGVSATVRQPNSMSSENLVYSVTAETASAAKLGSETFAEGGIGKSGKGGSVGVTVDKTEGGYYVNFEPALNLGGAMTITSFSDQMRMALPDWLQDEIFDVTFGGDPKAQVFVPARPECPAWDSNVEYTRPARREVQVVAGTLKATRASGDMIAEAGSCVGETLSDESTLTLTSDWAELGFSCSQ